jgi:hypothetical protein
MAAPAAIPAVAFAGKYLRTFTLDGKLAEIGDFAAVNHGLAREPIDFHIVDTTALATTDVFPWAIITVNATQFIARKLIATNEDRTALVVLRDVHSELR